MVNQKKLDELIKAKISLIENSPNSFYSKVEKEQVKILKDLLKDLGSLDTKDGTILTTQHNIDLVDSIDKKLKKSFYKSDYISATNDLIKDLDKTKSLTVDYFKEGFALKNTKKQDLIFNVNRKQFLESLIGVNSTETALFNPIKQNILDGVTNGTTYKELVNSISTTVTGNDKVDGTLQKYAKQIAGDSFSATERNFTKAVSEALSIQWYRYTGGELPDTRCFCEERNGNYYHINEIKSWGDGKNIGAGCGYPWQGMYKGTNSGNIMTWLGGYNCKHSLIPVSLAIVPMSVIQKAIDDGFFKPDEAEKELLGL